MYSGTSGVLAKFVVRVIFRLLGLGFIHRTIVVNKSLDEFHVECKNHKLRLSMMCWVIDKLISNAGLALLAGTYALVICFYFLSIRLSHLLH
jgi:hypothetical protein